MTKRQVRWGHCHRCVYTWRMRYRVPRLCPRCKSRRWNVPKLRPVRPGSGPGIPEILGPHRDEIRRLADQHGASNVRVFGSVRRGEATPTSDVDLLVTWAPGTSLFDAVRFRRAVAALLGRPVDVVEEPFLHWSVRPQVMAEAVPL